jgi:UDP-2,4-diacetamido-2,4,6-trideoxy-beta-L-altropyranose hydrolase
MDVQGSSTIETMKRIIFRTDASNVIGSGHIMRCLTLAKYLRNAGAICCFICREHPGHMNDFIRSQGFEVIGLNLPEAKMVATEVCSESLAHAPWLGVDWQTDAEQTKSAFGELLADWLIVDHYSLDARWERTLASNYRKLMVIDDLADRHHVCDVLLDQNMVEGLQERYQGKVPDQCSCLIGPQYALLRPEFVQLRVASLARRAYPKLSRLLVFLGGSDVENETSKVIDGLLISKRNWDHIDVVVGQGFPALNTLQKKLQSVNLTATLHIQTNAMAELMSKADLAITAGGSITWEKCVLGLPSFVVIQGCNQQPIARKMHQLGALHALGLELELTPYAYAQQLDRIQPHDLTEMTKSAQAICDGSGMSAILQTMEIAS